MQAETTISFGEAAASWLVGRSPRLSSATERAYLGEVDRLAQFFAVKYGLLDLSQLAQEHWFDYLEELGEAREHVVTSRKASLAASSASQAIRILRAFLRWARDEGLISWAPRNERSAKVTESMRRVPLVDLANRKPMHPAVLRLLHSTPPTDAPLEELRARLAIGMAYWVGLKTADIAALRVSNLTLGRHSLEVRHPKNGAASVAPQPVALCWERYRGLREDGWGPLRERSPVISAIGANDPVTSWAIWAMIGRTLDDLTGVQGQSAQSLRRCRISELSQSYADEVNRLATYARRVTVDFGFSV